jgi:transketolase
VRPASPRLISLEDVMGNARYTEIDEININTIRLLAADAVQAAESGHPGMPMGMAAPAYVLWSRFLRHNPGNPLWPNRDRFILSAGHGSMLLYALLHLSGYELSLDELRRFRQWGSMTPGHPERGLTPGVETTTGPLGQGFGNGVGMAIAERYLAHLFNRPGHGVVDHYTYAIVSDGDLMEGVASEAASLAGHLRLGKLIYLYDDNGISIEGSTDLSFTEDVPMRFRAYGWQVQAVDGLDLPGIEEAIHAAQAERERPSLIAVKTHIGYGSPNKQDTAAAHGEPLGADEVRLTKQALGWPLEPAFYIPDAVRGYFQEQQEHWSYMEADWHRVFEEYRQAYPELAESFERAMAGELPAGWQERLSEFPPGVAVATRNASGEVLSAIAPVVPALVGGSADLAPSTKTYLQGFGDQQAANPGGRNLRFGVREHAMGAIVNGLAAHGGVRPFGSTFFVFSDYMRPALRLSALMALPVVWVYTHDSILVGEDGPTHQPVEQLASLRAIPHLVTIRPADANETVVAWQVALERQGPTALILTRQNVPVFDRRAVAPATGLRRGAYVLLDAEGRRPDLILIGTGSEVSLAMEAQAILATRDIQARVVSMPSWELFEAQPAAYRQEVLPDDVLVRLAVEAGSPQGWERYVGPFGGVLGISGRFGASAPYKVLATHFGFTAANVVAQAEALLESQPKKAQLMAGRLACAGST